MGPTEINFVLAILSLVAATLVTIILSVISWFARREVSRHDECLRHLEANSSAIAKEFDEWRRLDSVSHAELAGKIGEIGGRVSYIDGRLITTGTLVQDMTVEMRQIAQRVAVLSEETRSLDRELTRRMTNIERNIHFLRFRDDEETDQVPK